MLTKELRYESSLYPLAAMLRVRKFLEKNWVISAGQIVKILWDVRKLDLENPSVLCDQLQGVDYEYLREVIDKLKHSSDRIDGTYLFQLLDSAFN